VVGSDCTAQGCSTLVWPIRRQWVKVLEKEASEWKRGKTIRERMWGKEICRDSRRNGKQIEGRKRVNEYANSNHPYRHSHQPHVAEIKCPLKSRERSQWVQTHWIYLKCIRGQSVQSITLMSFDLSANRREEQPNRTIIGLCFPVILLNVEQTLRNKFTVFFGP